MPMALAGPRRFVPGGQLSGGASFFSGEDEEGEEGCQQQVYPQPCPAAVYRVGAGCLNGASIPAALPLLLCGTTQIISV